MNQFIPEICPFANYIVKRLRMEIKANKIVSSLGGFRKEIITDSFSDLQQDPLGASSECGKLQEVTDIIVSFGLNSSFIAMATQLQVVQMTIT